MFVHALTRASPRFRLKSWSPPLLSSLGALVSLISIPTKNVRPEASPATLQDSTQLTTFCTAACLFRRHSTLTRLVFLANRIEWGKKNKREKINFV